jgi:hypothetical protein
MDAAANADAAVLANVMDLAVQADAAAILYATCDACECACDAS